MKQLSELSAIRKKTAPSLTIRTAGPDAVRVAVGMSTCGIAAGARAVVAAFADAIDALKIEDTVIVQTECAGMCRLEPIVEIGRPDGERVVYVRMDAGKAARVAREHLKEGKPVLEYTISAAGQDLE